MTHLLDTNVCIQFLRGKNAKVLARFAAQSPADLAISSIALAELLYGAERARDPAKERAAVRSFTLTYPILAYDAAAAEEYIRARLHLEARGQMIGHFDLMIAATALAHGLTVVTHNTGEFARVPGLATGDWEV